MGYEVARYTASGTEEVEVEIDDWPELAPEMHVTVRPSSPGSASGTGTVTVKGPGGQAYQPIYEGDRTTAMTVDLSSEASFTLGGFRPDAIKVASDNAADEFTVEAGA
jgi:hypothetical protein